MTKEFRLWCVREGCFYESGFSVSWDGLYWYDDNSHERVIHEDFYILSEFTGLYDKHGTKIFEYDILDFDPEEWNRPLYYKQEKKYPKWEVKWDAQGACWDTGGGTTGDVGRYQSVVGNTFENPEIKLN